MLVGYARVSKSDGNLDLQKDSLSFTKMRGNSDRFAHESCLFLDKKMREWNEVGNQKMNMKHFWRSYHSKSERNKFAWFNLTVDWRQLLPQ